jgi:hypothetical protein
MSDKRSKIVFGEAFKRFKNREPAQMSKKTREYARKVLECCQASQNEDSEA